MTTLFQVIKPHKILYPPKSNPSIGTPEERGLAKWQEQHKVHEESHEASDCYDLPYITEYLRKWSWTQNLPFSPTFKGWHNNKVRPE